MPRNGSGTWSAPANTEAVPNQQASSTGFNTLIDDIGDALTDSLSRSGQGGMTADLALGNNDITGVTDITASGIVTVPNTGLHILDTNATHDLIIAPGSNLTADRTLTVTTGDAARTLDMSAGSLTAGGGQYVFPASQNASANANTLDDYEEGTFTPASTIGGSTTGITYTTQSGLYIKIGKLVTFRINIVYSSIGGLTGAVVFTGLPFTAGATAPGGAHLTFHANCAGLTSAVLFRISSGGTSIDAALQGAVNTTGLTHANLTDTAQFIMVGSFEASA